MSQPSSNQPASLAERCKAYLQQSPPDHMTNYIPGSMLEIIIAHGAKSLNLDPELREMGSFILQDAQDAVEKQQDAGIRSYLQQGADLVRQVLER
jgi:hypothetical protein